MCSSDLEQGKFMGERCKWRHFATILIQCVVVDNTEVQSIKIIGTFHRDRKSVV